jgi:RNA polymerase sigma-70 factor (ECF subfamily)
MSAEDATREHHPNDLDPAFTPLLAYDKRLVNLALRVLGDRDEALDAVQEAYLQAYRAFHTFRGDAQPYTWLCRITLNECARRGRKKTARRTREVDLEILRERGAEPSGEAPGHEAVERGRTADLVREVVEHLPSPYREAVILRYYEDMSYEEIANVSGCSLGTVKSRLARAHAKLESRLPVDLLQDV